MNSPAGVPSCLQGRQDTTKVCSAHGGEAWHCAQPSQVVLSDTPPCVNAGPNPRYSQYKAAAQGKAHTNILWLHSIKR